MMQTCAYEMRLAGNTGRIRSKRVRSDKYAQIRGNATKVAQVFDMLSSAGRIDQLWIISLP